MSAALRVLLKVPSSVVLWRIALVLVCAVGYGLSIAPTVSLWDCGEFIAAAHTLGIPHPPGTPFYMLLGRAFELLFPLGQVAFRYNVLSALASTLTCLFVFEIGVLILRRIGASLQQAQPCAWAAAALLAFSDTFWFNAVEAEVYGISMLQMVVGVWLILRRDSEVVGWSRNRWLVLYVFLTFLGTGLHMYSLLTLPLVWLYVGYGDGAWRWGRASAFLVAVGALATMWLFQHPTHLASGVFLGIIGLALLGGMGWAYRRGELRNLEFWGVGLLLFSVIFVTHALMVSWALWTLLFALTLLVLGKGGERWWLPLLAIPMSVALLIVLPPEPWGAAHYLLVGAGVFVLVVVAGSPRSQHSVKLQGLLWILLAAGWGYSVQLYLPVRSQLNPVIDENNPENWDNFRAALERQQYQADGMLQRAFLRRGEPQHQLGFHPRIGYLGFHLNQFSPAPLGAQEPGSWRLVQQKGVWGLLHVVHRIFWEMVLVLSLMGVWAFRRHPVVVWIGALFGLASLGLVFYVNFADGSRPDSGAALRWMRSLQGIGQQAQDQGHSIPPIPNLVPLQEEMRLMELQAPEQRNAFISSPRAANLRHWGEWIQVARKLGRGLPRLPGPVHLEVRERDYFFAPAFIFFALLLAMALWYGWSLLPARWQEGRIAQRLSGVLALLWMVPFGTHYPSHTRSQDWVAWDFAYNILNSVPQGGVVFTNGDNDTFPLWYLQLVEGVRTDVAVINLALSSMDWYREQMRRIHPHIQHAWGEEEIQSRTYKREEAPRWPQFGDTTQTTETWMPSSSDLFVLGMLTANGSEVPFTFMFSTTEREMLGLLPYAPLVGLVRQPGVAQAQADSLLAHRLVGDYQYRGLQSGQWRWQDGAVRVVASYRYLASEALKVPARDSRVHEELLRLRTLLYTGP